MNTGRNRQPITVKNLADFKRHIQPGTEILMKSHSVHPDLIGLTRVVTKVQTNGFYSVIKGQPKNKWSVCNGGNGIRQDFEPASCYRFNGNSIQILDRRRAGAPLCEIELYEKEQTQKMNASEKKTVISHIPAENLRRMEDTEGLILQGCGGDPQDWLDGINDLLTREDILLNGTRFPECAVFEHEGHTNILFPFRENVQLEMGRLAMWRLQTHDQFGGTWLSDYVPNRLGGFETPQATKAQSQTQKPDCPLIGQDGNIFNLTGIAARTLRRNGLRDRATEMCNRVYACGSYYEALNVIGEYVNITSVDDPDESEDFEADPDIDCDDEDEDERFEPSLS